MSRGAHFILDITKAFDLVDGRSLFTLVKAGCVPTSCPYSILSSRYAGPILMAVSLTAFQAVYLLRLCFDSTLIMHS